MIKVMTVKPKLLDQVRHATRVRHLRIMLLTIEKTAHHIAQESLLVTTQVG